MNDAEFSGLSRHQMERIDAVCVQFESALKSDAPRSIEDCLAGTTEELREPLFRELVEAEMNIRGRNGERLSVDEYLSRFPQFSNVVGRIFGARMPSGDDESRATDSIPGVDTDSLSLGRTEYERTPVGARPGSTDDAPGADGLPREFGRYRLTRLLGRGGMGSVYLAYDRELDRDVALKMPEFDVKPDAARMLADRFQREARSMATVQHPNVCPIHDVGEHDGQRYLTMAYIRGRTLSDIVRDGRQLPTDEAVNIVRTLAEALQAVHEAGVVHRDLKPGNVLVDEQQRLFITDFGLASRDRAIEADLTQENSVIGSPAYMAPEQVRAQHDRIGPATDVYALGVTLYELLCGRRPFSGDGLEVLGQISSGNPPTSPSELANIDDQLAAICLKAMAHEPDDRFPTASDLASSLEPYSRASVVGKTISRNQPPGAGPRFLQPDAGAFRLMKHPRSSLVIAALVLVAIISAAAMSVFRIETPYGDVVVRAVEGVDVQVEVHEAGSVVAVLGRDNNWQVRLEAGKYLLKLQGGGHELRLDRDTVEVSRDGRIEVTIVRNARERAGRSPLLPPLVKPTKRSSGQFVESGQQFDESEGGNPSTGDLDGDGDWDLVVVSKFADQPARVWLNDGTGTFRKTQEFAFDSSSFGIDLGDLDADGDLDVFITNTSSTVPGSVWKNDGQGTFENTGQTIGPAYSRCVRLGDVDGDGDLDALAGIRGPNRLWRNDGTGSFLDSGHRIGNSDSWDVQFADFDADGDLDALVVNYGGASRVWLNDGKGTFTDSGQRLGGDTSMGTGAAVSDVDADGDPDAFVICASQSAHLWINDGAGNFTHALEQDTGTLPTHDIVAADLNGDQRDDFFIANGGAITHRPDQLLLATDEGFASSWIGNHCTGFAAVADFDGDGDIDLFLGGVAGVEPNRLLLNRDEDRSESPYFRDSGQSLGNSFSTHVEVADLDDDGDLDAFVTNYKAPDTVWWNDGKGTFTDSGQRLGDSRSVRAQLGDLDGDGDQDVFVPNAGGKPNQVYINDGNGVFRDSGQLLGSYGSKAVALSDFDNDGDLDAFVANWSYGRANRLYLNDGQAGFTDSGQQIGNDSGYDTAAADFDGDGDDDLFVVSVESTNRLYLNDGDGVFVDGKRTLGSASTGVACGDVDGDVDVDVLVANHGFNHVWLNDGEANFTEGGQFDAGVSADISLADVDRDGDLDAFVSNNGINSLWHNDGHGVFGKVQWFGGNISTHAALADFDGDGDIDAFVTNEDGPNRVLLGSGQPGVTSTIPQ